MWDLWWIKQHKTLLLVFRFSSVSSHSVMLHINSHSVKRCEYISTNSSTAEIYSHPTAKHKVIKTKINSVELKPQD